VAFTPGIVPTHHHEFALAARPDDHHGRHLVWENSEHGWKVAKAKPACLVLLNAAAYWLLAEAPPTEERQDVRYYVAIAETATASIVELHKRDGVTARRNLSAVSARRSRSRTA
jgi:hypothetical protein